MGNILFQPKVTTDMITKFNVPVLAYYNTNGYKNVESYARIIAGNSDIPTDDSYIKCIKEYVQGGQERALIHFQVVYLLFKQQPCDMNVYKELFEMQNVATSNISITENKHFFIISGNILQFKNIVRNWRKRNNLVRNKIIDTINESFFEFESCLFADFIIQDQLDNYPIGKFKTPAETKLDIETMESTGAYNKQMYSHNDVIPLHGTDFKLQLCEGDKVLMNLHSSILEKHNTYNVISSEEKESV